MARIKPKQLLIQSKTKKAPSRISYSTIITWNLIVVLVVLSLYATYRHWHQRLLCFLHPPFLFILLFGVPSIPNLVNTAIHGDEVCSCQSFLQLFNKQLNLYLLLSMPVLMCSTAGRPKILKWTFIKLRYLVQPHHLFYATVLFLSCAYPICKQVYLIYVTDMHYLFFFLGLFNFISLSSDNMLGIVVVHLGFNLPSDYVRLQQNETAN